MKKISVFLCGTFFLLLTMGSANAALTTIGTAQFNGIGPEYKLIWDDDNNGKSLVWLDYTNTPQYWAEQKAWTEDLNTTLTYNIDPGYIVDWGVNPWRLPSTVDGLYVWGYTGTTTAGYNITSSEMGHLFYEELGNIGLYSKNGMSQSLFGLKKTDGFNNLVNSVYWSSTEYATTSDSAWILYMSEGYQGLHGRDGVHCYGLAVHEAQVSTVPLPSTFWLLGSGLIGLVGLDRKRSVQ